MPVLAALSLSGSVIQAQDFDNNPVVNVSNSKENLNFTIGARFMMDGAYYHSDFTPVKSGAAITDARIRTSMSYEDWYFYADFDFSKGKFSQKNIFLQYSLEGAKGTHRFKAGYYNNPVSMANNIICISVNKLINNQVFQVSQLHPEPFEEPALYADHCQLSISDSFQNGW